MVAPTDPNGIIKAHAPTSHEHTIDNWGFVFGGMVNRRVLLFVALVGGAFFAVLVGAFLLVRFGGHNVHADNSAGFVRAAEMDAPALTAAIRRNDVRSVLRLVGTDGPDAESYAEERATCERLGVPHFVAKMAATRAPYRSEMARVFEVLDMIDADRNLQPVLIHCSAGSDRTGLVSVIWMHDYRGQPLAEARKQLAWAPYMHVSFGEARHMGEFLDRYEAFLAANPGKWMNIQQWTKLHYFEEKPGREAGPWHDGRVYRP